MKIKRKGAFAVVLFALLLCVLTLFLGFSIRTGAKTVSAATTPKYRMTFNYNGQYSSTTEYMDGEKYSGETTLLTVGSFSYFDSFTFGLYLYGSGMSGDAVLPYGGTIHSNYINIIADVKTEYSFVGNSSLLTKVQLYNSKGDYKINYTADKVSDTYSTTLFSGNVSDDIYTLTIEWKTHSKPNTFTNEFSFTTITTMFVIQADPCVGGHNYKATVTDPTCTAEGYTTYTCTVCGDSYKGEKKSAVGHSYQATQTTTCTGETTTYRCSRCGDTYSKTTGNGIGHSYTATTTAPTCTSGYTTYSCSRCGNSYTGNKTSALGHSYTATTTAPSCTSDGYTTYSCSRCGNSYTGNRTSALGHSYTATTTAPSCTSDGYTTYSCSRCGNSYNENKTPALGHSLSSARSISCTLETTVYTCSRCNYSTVSTGEGYGHDYVPSVTKPTCTSGGYTIFTCSNCGESYRDNETQPLGHNYTITQNNSCTGGTTNYKCSRCGQTYSESTQGGLGHSYVAFITAPTCVDRGYTIYVCSRCGDSYRDNETQALGHNYVPSVVSATCTASGYTVYTCSRCENSYRSEETQATGHRYVSSSHPATCSEGGYTLHECEICGVNYRDNETQPLGHNFITETELPTCTEFGVTVYSCQVCGYQKRESDGTYPTGHSFTNTIVSAATCTTDGMRKNVCDKCGEAVETRIPALGHHYEITSTSTSGDNTIRHYTCSVCGDSYTQELGNQYEQVTSYVEYLLEQYAPYMYWVLLATAGLWSIAIGVAIIIAVKNEDKATAKKMLVNYVIGLVVIFAIVVACPYLMRGIAALIT